MKSSHPTKWNVLQFLAAIPAVFVAVVSRFVACPACWPLVGGLISALGLTSLLETRLMLPLFVGCLLLAIAPLALQARSHLQPFILGLIASAFVLSESSSSTQLRYCCRHLPFSSPASGAITRRVTNACVDCAAAVSGKRPRRKIFNRLRWTSTI
jgi:hypothetical protein